MATAAKKSTTTEPEAKYTPSTELVAQSEGVKSLLATGKNVSMADVLRRAHNAVAAAKRRATEMVHSGSKLPKPTGSLALTGDQMAALDRVVQLAANAPALPSSPRELSEAELEALTARFLAAKNVASIFESWTKGVRAAVLNHLTIKGEREGTITAETPRDKSGWALVEAEFSAPGESEVLSVETQSGGARITAADIEALEEEGVLSHRDVLECTQFVRQIEENGWFKLIARKPYLAVLLAERASHDAPKVSLYKRNR